MLISIRIIYLVTIVYSLSSNLTTILGLDVILSLNDLWTFGFFFTFIGMFGLWATTSRREKKKFGELCFTKFSSQK
jgi:hypothetical protein